MQGNASGGRGASDRQKVGCGYLLVFVGLARVTARRRRAALLADMCLG